MRSALLFAAVVVATSACGDAERTATDLETITVPVHVDHNRSTAEVHGTHMDGSEEVPAVATVAFGRAGFRLNADGTELRYGVVVARIENITQSHIHLAAAGVNGPIVAWLYPSAPPAQLIPGPFNGLLAQGVIRDADVVGVLAGTGVAGLMEQLRAGNTYVNVHTSQFPPGEIRGQID